MEKTVKQTQMRRCAACRKVTHKSGLLRIVKLSDGKIFVDVTGKAQGRGAYVCKSVTCAAELKKRRYLDRSFKTTVSVEIYDEIDRHIAEIGN